MNDRPVDQNRVKILSVGGSADPVPDNAIVLDDGVTYVVLDDGVTYVTTDS